MYGQAASHTRTVDASELTNQITIERQKITSIEKRRQTEILRETKQK